MDHFMVANGYDSNGACQETCIIQDHGSISIFNQNNHHSHNVIRQQIDIAHRWSIALPQGSHSIHLSKSIYT